MLLNTVLNSANTRQFIQESEGLNVAVVGFRTRFSKYSVSGSLVFS